MIIELQVTIAQKIAYRQNDGGDSAGTNSNGVDADTGGRSSCDDVSPFSTLLGPYSFMVPFLPLITL